MSPYLSSARYSRVQMRKGTGDVGATPSPMLGRLMGRELWLEGRPHAPSPEGPQNPHLAGGHHQRPGPARRQAPERARRSHSALLRRHRFHELGRGLGGPNEQVRLPPHGAADRPCTQGCRPRRLSNQARQPARRNLVHLIRQAVDARRAALGSENEPDDLPPGREGSVHPGPAPSKVRLQKGLLRALPPRPGGPTGRRLTQSSSSTAPGSESRLPSPRTTRSCPVPPLRHLPRILRATAAARPGPPLLTPSPAIRLGSPLLRATRHCWAQACPHRVASRGLIAPPAWPSPRSTCANAGEGTWASAPAAAARSSSPTRSRPRARPRHRSHQAVTMLCCMTAP